MPIYQYQCKNCGNEFERIEKVSGELKVSSFSSWKLDKQKSIQCPKCRKNSAKKVVSRFKVGSKVLETTGKSGYLTDDFTMGKLIDEGGIPYEEQSRLREREKMIKRQKKYTKSLKWRAKKYKFDPSGE